MNLGDQAEMFRQIARLFPALTASALRQGQSTHIATATSELANNGREGQRRSRPGLHSPVNHSIALTHNSAISPFVVYRKTIALKGNSLIARSALQPHSKRQNGEHKQLGQRPVSAVEPASSVNCA